MDALTYTAPEGVLINKRQSKWNLRKANPQFVAAAPPMYLEGLVTQATADTSHVTWAGELGQLLHAVMQVLEEENDEPPSDASTTRAIEFSLRLSEVSQQVLRSTFRLVPKPDVCISFEDGFSFNWQTTRGFLSIKTPVMANGVDMYYYYDEQHESHEGGALTEDSQLYKLLNRL